MSQPSILDEIKEYRLHFDQMYIGGIPALLNDTGAFLSFLVVLTATEALAGLSAPSTQTGDRFRAFVATYFPAEYEPHVERLWQFRNAMVHSFNPGPFTLSHQNSRNHLKVQRGVPMLNAEDFYGSLLVAARAYFEELVVNSELQSRFRDRIAASDGGAPQVWVVQQAPSTNGAA